MIFGHSQKWSSKSSNLPAATEECKLQTTNPGYDSLNVSGDSAYEHLGNFYDCRSLKDYDESINRSIQFRAHHRQRRKRPFSIAGNPDLREKVNINHGYVHDRN